MNPDNIITIARSYIGQKEVLGNKGFEDPTLLQRMKLAGWQSGYAWCALLAEIIWKESIGKDNPLWAQLDHLFSASSLSTYYNFAHAQGFEVGQVPKHGALVIWKHGIDPKKWEGHTGIVTGYDDKTFASVEGNTSGTDPNIREGYIVAEKTHLLKAPKTAKTLNLIGFVYPPL
jgi:hypothetical protein